MAFDLSNLHYYEFKHRDYGKRLTIKEAVTNPRGELGKNGLSYHTGFSKYLYKTISVKLSDHDGNEKKFHLNRSSLIKWINAQLDTDDEKLTEHSSDKKIIKGFESLTGEEYHPTKTSDAIGYLGKRQGTTLFHLGNAIRGSFLGVFWRATVATFTGFAARFKFLMKKEQAFIKAGELRARKSFWQAYKHVPAYQEFVDAEVDGGVNFKNREHINQFTDLPETSKDNYIKPNGNTKARLHMEGKLPINGKIDTSTGTTGEPCSWWRGARELKTVRTLLQYAARLQAAEKPIVCINAFAPGPWATGLTTHEVMTGVGVVITTGPDIDKILKILEEYHRELADPDTGEMTRQIVIAGYPPFLKDLVDEARRRAQKNAADNQNYDKDFFGRYDALAVVGGQGMSEAMRDTLLKDVADDGQEESKIFREVFSSYGASDLDINLGFETEFERTIRRECEKNHLLKQELFGDKRIPMVFHYDPMNYHVEENAEGKLVFTCSRGDRSAPRVRYNLGDEGKVVAVSDVLAILQRHDIHLEAHQLPNTLLPLMFIWGRDSTVTFRGANLSFTDYERAITEIPLLRNHAKKYAFYNVEDNGDEKLQLWIELQEGSTIQDLGDLLDIRNQLVKQMCEVNQDFRYQVEQLTATASYPEVRFFEASHSPMRDANNHRKQVLIFDDEHQHIKEYFDAGRDLEKESTLVSGDIIHSPACDSQQQNSISC